MLIDHELKVFLFEPNTNETYDAIKECIINILNKFKNNSKISTGEVNINISQNGNKCDIDYIVGGKEIKMYLG